MVVLESLSRKSNGSRFLYNYNTVMMICNDIYTPQFTRKNLKLVHIVCHDKQEHSEKKCDPKMFYISKNRFTSPASCPTSRNRSTLTSGTSRCSKTSDKELKLQVKLIRKAKDTRLALPTNAIKELTQKSANRKRKVCTLA